MTIEEIGALKRGDKLTSPWGEECEFIEDLHPDPDYRFGGKVKSLREKDEWCACSFEAWDKG